MDQNTASQLSVEKGSSAQLGAVYDGKGVNFALFSANATKVELCLFSDDGKEELCRIPLTEKSADNIWHGYVPTLEPGQVYGYRVHGAFDPANGHRFDSSKLLLDPYAREITGDIKWTKAHTTFGADTAADTVKGRVTAPMPKIPLAPQIPWNDMLICEAHLKGYTMADPKVPQELRGTAAGMASAPVLHYINEMRYTGMEFLPVQAKLHDDRLEKMGLKNYWGYNNYNFFVIEPELLKTGKREEFRDMVLGLRAQGVETILDVVFNHTAEGNHLGPTLSFRGIDNASYYKLLPHDKARYIDEAGCGNTLDFEKPMVRRMVIDTLRMFVEEFGVAGFRFDLATVLGRKPEGFTRDAPFFKEIAADPVLSKIKLIAEPWDCAPGGYQLGGFPRLWHEWNDKFRDDLRHYWREDASMIGKNATRLAGSSPEFARDGGGPLNSINFITCHDGFTLHDVVSHSYKKNFANGEDNRDGNNDNISHNHGAEGETFDENVIRRRERTKRNFLTSLFLAQGTPMVLAGDEFGNSQGGNNNAYCQDNPIGWLNWDKITDKDRELQQFVKKLAQFREDNPILQHDAYLHGQKTCHEGLRDIHWFNPTGREMRDSDWSNHYDKCVGMFLNEGAVNGKGTGKRLLAVFNAASSNVDFTLPALRGGDTWERVLDTSEPQLEKDARNHKGRYSTPEKSIVVFVQQKNKPQ